METYVKDVVNNLLKSDKRNAEITLKSKNDYKKNLFRILYNKLSLTLQQKIVPSHAKNALLRTTGMHVGKDACIPHDIYFDPYFPELISLKKGSLIGGGCTVITHKVAGNKLTLGRCVLEERTMTAGLCELNPGAVLSKHSMLNLYSALDTKTGDGELWSGKPAKLMKKLAAEEIEKFFKPSTKDKNYYKTFRKKLKEFIHDPKQNYFKIHYDGRRLNAGMDWWRARNILRIFYNGIIIELTRLLPHGWLKTILLKMTGVKIGKKVYIGKGVVFDHIYCDSITVEDNVRIDDYSYLDGHEYTITQTVFGKTRIKNGAHLKHHSFIRTGTTIGENSVIEPYSMAQREIPDNETWGGIPAVKK